MMVLNSIILYAEYTKRTKGKKWTVWLHFIPKNEIIFVYTLKYVDI